MEGYNYDNLKHVMNIQENFKLFNQKNSSLSEIEKLSKFNEINNLEYLLIADYSKREIIEKILLNNNWEMVKSFKEENYKSTLLVFKKKS